MQLQISVEQLRKNKLFVATPMYGGMCLGMYMKACLDLQGLCGQYGMENRFSFIFNESLITRARNYLVDEFLRSGYSHMLFIDADIHFDPKDVIALMALDKDIIGAPYPKKSIKWNSAITAMKRRTALIDQVNAKNAQITIDNQNLAPGVTPTPWLDVPNELTAQELEQTIGDYVFNAVAGTGQFNVGEPLEVMEIGTGYMMIKREVFVKWAAQYPQYAYKPDHVGQANFDGSRYIHAYFDTIIDRGENAPGNSERYLSEDYFFCCSAASLIETEEGQKSIKWIVDNKYSGKVLSQNIDGSLEWNRVIGWSGRRNGKRMGPKKTWVKFNTSSDNNTKPKVKITSDHRVAVFDDVFNPQIYYIPAIEAAGKYIVRKPEQRGNHNESVLYGTDQLSFLAGTLMGDSSIGKNNQLTMVHCEEQEDYINLKANIFNGKVSEKRPQTGFGTGKFAFDMWVPINEQTRALRDLVYVDGKKCVSKLLSLMDEKGLAFWYMDDGSYNINSGTRLSTCSFSYDDHVLIKNWFDDKYGISIEIDDKFVEYDGTIRKYNTIRFNKEGASQLFDIIAKYIPDSMRYKLPVYHRDIPLFDYSSVKSLDYAAAYVEEVEVCKNQQMGKLYDIEVENNHNFFASGTLVHNCQMWRKMGGSIWLCPWMRSFHVGTYAFQGNMASVAQFVGNL